MRAKTLVIVCEVGKPLYQAELSYQQMTKLLRDSLEGIRPSMVRAWGNECPLSNGFTLIAGGNARCKDSTPPVNRFGILGTFLIAGPNGHSIRRDKVSAVMAAINKFDAEQKSRTFHLPEGVKSAPEWERLGHAWNPSAHLTGDMREADEFTFINGLLQKYAAQLVAHYFYQPLPMMYSLELQFAETSEGREQARSFVREYEAAFNSNGRVKPGVIASLQLGP